MENNLPHTYFDGEIYEWSLRMNIGVWVSVENTKMDRQTFINSIIYLIACGEPLVFNNEISAFKRVNKFNFKNNEYGN